MKPKIGKDRRIQMLHYLSEDGVVACNPRDREAAHRAEVEGFATRNARAVTYKKCQAVIPKSDRGRTN